jgi:hypothetical protein
MTMDLGQITQMTTWLDEEHRRDKAELIRLQQRLESQEGEQLDQARVIKDLETRLVGVQSQLLKFTQFEKALQQLKDEIVHMFAQSDDRRQLEGREGERVRAIERDNVARSLNELRRELQRLPRLDEEVGLRKAEQRRVSDAVLVVQQDLAAVKQDVENKVRSIPFLEDGRQQDAKRIARLQQESLEALKRIEQHASRLQVLEDVHQRQERDLGEVKELASQVRSSQREFIEKQLLETEQVKRQVTEWVETLESQFGRLDEFAASLREFGEAFRQDRQVVESVERFQEVIRREQTQVTELQRLAEERQKRQLEQWVEENEKRWKKELLRWDYQWSEQAKRNGQVSEQFTVLEAQLMQHLVEIEATWKFLESQINYQTQESRRWVGEMTRLLEERPKKEK